MSPFRRSLSHFPQTPTLSMSAPAAASRGAKVSPHSSSALQTSTSWRWNVTVWEGFARLTAAAKLMAIVVFPVPGAPAEEYEACRAPANRAKANRSARISTERWLFIKSNTAKGLVYFSCSSSANSFRTFARNSGESLTCGWELILGSVFQLSISSLSYVAPWAPKIISHSPFGYPLLRHSHHLFDYVAGEPVEC